MAPNKVLPKGAREEDVIRALSYHRRDFDMAVIRIKPKDNLSVQPGITNPPNRPFNPAIPGLLDRLPLEILLSIIPDLDIQSIFSLRRVNARTRDIISSLKTYQQVTTHALSLMCALLRTNLAQWYTLQDIVDVLHTRECTICGGEFGGFVSLPPPKLTRCCYSCIQQKAQIGRRVVDPFTRRFSIEQDHELITLSEAHNLYGISPAVLRRESVPIMKTLRGVYTMNETERKKQHSLVYDKRVRELSINHKRGIPWSDTYRRGREMFLRWCMATTAVPYVDPETGEVERGVSCKGCQSHFEEISSRPRNFGDLSASRDKVYSRAGFLMHFRECRWARRLWEASEGGTVPVWESKFVRLGGYMKDRDGEEEVVVGVKKEVSQDKAMVG
ncbi:hypothetical protein AbraIFM66950_012047 [Aspergillus brasiliensis]|nr:hypothetical protein AbraIFM66950_012047 [Aspergillus brasiliensis]